MTSVLPTKPNMMTLTNMIMKAVCSDSVNLRSSELSGSDSDDAAAATLEEDAADDDDDDVATILGILSMSLLIESLTPSVSD